MHVILATVGTDGDVLPFIGLGTVLRSRGHRITLAAPETYRTTALRLGMEFCDLVTVAEVQRMLGNPDLWHPFRSGLMMARWGGPMIRRQYQALTGAAQHPDSILVANAGVLAARLVQEKHRVRMATLLLQPAMLQSSIAPPRLPGGVIVPTWLPMPMRHLYWIALDAAGYFLLASSLNPVRHSLELPSVRRVFRWWLSPERVIGLFPSWYAPHQSDWPKQVRLVGFGRFEGTSERLPEEVKYFCDSGPPPVVFTLGTGMAHAAAFFKTAVDVCDSLRTRGLLLTKYRNLLPDSLPASVHHCTFAPFRKLLPHCSAIVHHGGVGTSAAALEAGCPQLVLPLAWDQPDNAARVASLGAGVVLGPRQRSSGHISEALSKLMLPVVREKCQAIASHAGHVNGLHLAADLVEELAVVDR